MEMQLNDGTSVHMKLVTTGFSLFCVEADDTYVAPTTDTLASIWSRQLCSRGDVLVKPVWLMNVVQPSLLLMSWGAEGNDLASPALVQRFEAALQEIDAKYHLDIEAIYRRLTWQNKHLSGSKMNLSSPNASTSLALTL